MMRRTARHHRGFTLLETALAMIIIGVGILSMMHLSAACTQQNIVGGKMTTVLLLAQNIQEATTDLSFNDPTSGRSYFGPESGESLSSFDDVDDFDGLTCNPPIDSMRASIAELKQYTQVVSVAPVYANQLSSNMSGSLPKTTYTGAVRVTAIILYRAEPSDPQLELYRTTWIRVDK